MKKLILIALAVASVSGIVHAASDKNCGTVNRLTANLELDEARAKDVEEILGSYMQVKDMAKNGQHMEIPAFLEAQQAQLAEVLNEEEMQKFMENAGDWAENMDFSKYTEFASKYHGSQH